MPRTKVAPANPAFLELADVEARRAERRAGERRSVADMVANVGKQLSPLLLELMKVEMVDENVLLSPSACYDVHTSWLLDDQSFIWSVLRPTSFSHDLITMPRLEDNSLAVKPSTKLFKKNSCKIFHYQYYLYRSF